MGWHYPYYVFSCYCFYCSALRVACLLSMLTIVSDCVLYGDSCVKLLIRLAVL